MMANIIFFHCFSEERGKEYNVILTPYQYMDCSRTRYNDLDSRSQVKHQYSCIVGTSKDLVTCLSGIYYHSITWMS